MYSIFTYISHTNQPNVGKYTSPMDAMGKGSTLTVSFLEVYGVVLPRDNTSSRTPTKTGSPVSGGFLDPEKTPLLIDLIGKDP